jgi:ribonuclease HII
MIQTVSNTESLWELDQSYREQFGTLVAGVDEAGRGPLAGSVVAACVVLDPQNPIDGLNDSKKLSEAKRESLFERIQREALYWGVGESSPEEIDEHNILQSTFLAMTRAIGIVSMDLAKKEKQREDAPLSYLLVDGNQMIPKLETPQETLVKGDSRSASIAAASILAKVTRDRQMKELEKVYPQYGFGKHKGYGTREHIAALLKHGWTPHHRKSFKPKALAQTSLFEF